MHTVIDFTDEVMLEILDEIIYAEVSIALEKEKAKVAHLPKFKKTMSMMAG